VYTEKEENNPNIIRILEIVATTLITQRRRRCFYRRSKSEQFVVSLLCHCNVDARMVVAVFYAVGQNRNDIFS
jgi:hypothetical protein